jgi:hypothetical protein
MALFFADDRRRRLRFPAMSITGTGRHPGLKPVPCRHFDVRAVA